MFRQCPSSKAHKNGVTCFIDHSECNFQTSQFPPSDPNIADPPNDSGTDVPFGCCASGPVCCRCCKDKCASLYSGNLDDIKACKGKCRVVYGRDVCKD